MNLVICFSPTGGTKKIADYAANYLNFQLLDLTAFKDHKDFNFRQEFDYLVLCFPVYSQNIPKPVKEIIKKLKAKCYILIATYGKMHMGNVLWEANKHLQGRLIGGAYIPTKHTYQEGDYFKDYQKLNSLLSRAIKKETKQIVIPKLKKNPFADFFPNGRSRYAIKIKKNANCNKCNHCNRVCPQEAINFGTITKDCIRCLSCYYNCPNKALEVKYSIFLKAYLKKDKIKDLIVY